MEFELSREHYLLKMVLCGDGFVGKTTLRRRYLGEGFEKSYLETIGADFAVRNIQIDNKSVKFQIWDLAGQPRYATVRPWYYKSALAGMIVFDVTLPDSFKNLPDWINELWNNNGSGKIPFIIIANKIDLRGGGNEISTKMAEEYVKKMNDELKSTGFEITYIETSAKTGENVDAAFTSLARQYFRYLENSDLL